LVFADIYLFQLHKLEVKVDQDSIRYRFAPYINRFRTIRKGEVKEIYVRKYQPIMEYGGWGYRIGLGKGRAYNIFGNWGLQLKFRNGKDLLLGTQKPEILKAAITKLKENWERA
jgi:hypothetical protein